MCLHRAVRMLLNILSNWKARSMWLTSHADSSAGLYTDVQPLMLGESFVHTSSDRCTANPDMPLAVVGRRLHLPHHIPHEEARGELSNLSRTNASVVYLCVWSTHVWCTENVYIDATTGAHTVNDVGLAWYRTVCIDQTTDRSAIHAHSS